MDMEQQRVEFLKLMFDVKKKEFYLIFDYYSNCLLFSKRKIFYRCTSYA